MTPKFRAWDKAKKVMCDVRSINFNLRTVYMLNRAGIGGQWSASFDDVILMQSTGLFDNSTPPKEIFEGDIVRFTKDDTVNITAVIVWDRDRCSFDFKHSYCRPFLNFRTQTNIFDIAWEVIGNIYENPELAEESSD